MSDNFWEAIRLMELLSKSGTYDKASLPFSGMGNKRVNTQFR